MQPQPWQHPHNFGQHNSHGERRTRWVLLLTAVTMVVEIVAGSLTGSMALLADGWHMGTHVAAFVITLFAYHYARRHADNPAFAFGTGKVNVLGGFASAVALAVVALLMAVESLHRLLEPRAIAFDEAIAVAALGLAVNLASAWLLKDQHHHHHDHEHDHEHSHDHNLRAAYLHVLADALTSVLAIVALLAGRYLGWHWLDPLMGLVGALIISRWAWGLVRTSSPILLDAGFSADTRAAIVEKLEAGGQTRVVDLHIWPLAAGHFGAILSLVSEAPQPPAHYHRLLAEFRGLSHLTVEVHPSRGTPAP